jgi:Uma2 family endonuclease
MGETDKHVDLIITCKEALRAYFADRPDVYIAGNNFLYFEEGHPKKCVSPDTYVIFGVPMRQRDCYMAWKEGGRLPNVVFEFTSKKTRREDTDKKRPLYESVLRVPEYFLFDPTGDYLKNPRLQGFRLVEGRYTPILMLDDRLHSEQLNLDLVQDGTALRFYDPTHARWLLTPLEQAQRADAEERRANEQAQRAEAAEAENARLRAEIEALKQR